MPNIVITEKDNTSPGGFGESFEVVYIPGFVDTSLEKLWADDLTKPIVIDGTPAVDEDGNPKYEKTYIGLEYHKPRLFTSISDFQAVCGETPLKFKNDQKYSDLVTDDSSGFDVDAIPFHDTMFKKGTPDPSYLMAMELLNSGMNVLYERINADELVSDPITFAASLFTVAQGSDAEPQYDYKECIFYDTTKEKIDTAFPPLPFKMGAGDGESGYKDAVLFGFDETQGGVVNGPYFAYKNGRYLNSSITGQTAEDDAVFMLELFAKDNKKEFTWTTGEGATAKKHKASIEVIEGTTYTYDGNKKAKGIVVPNCLLYEWNGDDVFEYSGENLSYSAVDACPPEWYTSFKNYYMEKEVETKGSSLTDAPTAADGYKTFRLVVDGATIKRVYQEELPFVYNLDDDRLKDKGNFSIKYLTSGAYPTYEYNSNSIVTGMLTLCSTRGDAYAIIEHTDNEGRTIDPALASSLYKTVENDSSLNGDGTYAAMFTPWAQYNIGTMSDEGPIRLPAGYAYLMSLADSIQTNASWLAVAGAARGVVRNLAQDGMTTIIPNGIADKMQKRNDGRAVNAIIDIKPYGYVIWGNRTLAPNKVDLTAVNFLNVRNLICDVKKVCYRTARKLTFEQNNDVLWVNFQAGIAPLLDQMVSGYGLSGYKILKNNTHPKASTKATLCAKILLYPVYPVEDFYIDILLEDDNIVIE